jgi:hypothetical protein
LASCSPSRRPAVAPGCARIGRLVVEDQDSVDGGVVADGDHDVAQPLDIPQIGAV